MAPTKTQPHPRPDRICRDCQATGGAEVFYSFGPGRGLRPVCKVCVKSARRGQRQSELVGERNIYAVQRLRLAIDNVTAMLARDPKQEKRLDDQMRSFLVKS